MDYSLQIKERRDFLKFIGRGTAAIASASVLSAKAQARLKSPQAPKVNGIAPTSKDDVVLAEGLVARKFLSWKQTINPQGDEFGFNNDYLAFVPIDSKRAWLWVNHESANPIFVSGWKPGTVKTKSQCEKEMKAVGGSLVQVKKIKGQWLPDLNHKKNKRFDANTPIPLISARPIQGTTTALGTIANCAGGVTPWGSFLTCEENFYSAFEDHDLDEKGQRVRVEKARKEVSWMKYFKRPSEHYGWVVEIVPETGEAKKLTGLGRFAHESATVAKAKDGRVVVYTGDDKDDECLYKFISDKPNSLHSGTLYVANVKKGRWIPLTIENKKLKSHFKDQTQIFEYTRKAAYLVGGTPLHRPEDIAIDPKTKAVFLAQTNHKKKLDFHGSILKVVEYGNDHGSLKFRAKKFLAGGKKNSFSSPDNLSFDKNGNLWICTDISERWIEKGPYAGFKNNGIFYVPMSGPQAGQVIQLASAPVDAEFTGLTFSPDHKSVFVSVQHPGNSSKGPNKWTSHWPDGGSSQPRPTVIELTGPLMDQLLA